MPSKFTSETQLHVTKFSSINNIAAEVCHEKYLRMSNYQASRFKPKNLFVCFFFSNNAPQSTVSVNKKRKIFSFLTR